VNDLLAWGLESGESRLGDLKELSTEGATCSRSLRFWVPTSEFVWAVPDNFLANYCRLQTLASYFEMWWTTNTRALGSNIRMARLGLCAIQTHNLTSWRNRPLRRSKGVFGLPVQSCALLQHVCKKHKTKGSRCYFVWWHNTTRAVYLLLLGHAWPSATQRRALHSTRRSGHRELLRASPPGMYLKKNTPDHISPMVQSNEASKTSRGLSHGTKISALFTVCQKSRENCFERVGAFLKQGFHKAYHEGCQFRREYPLQRQRLRAPVPSQILWRSTGARYASLKSWNSFSSPHDETWVLLGLQRGVESKFSPKFYFVKVGSSRRSGAYSRL